MQSANPTVEARISVAMCTYNGAKYLRQQIESILKQTHSNLELIIVDDASRDDTLAIIREYAAKDRRIIYQANAETLGYNRNFEKAIGLCKSECIAISDQDDIWELSKLETMMKNWPADSLYCYSLSGSFYGDDFKSRRAAPKIYYTNINDTHKLVFNSPVHGHASIFRKELIRHCLPFPPDIFYDWWLSMHAASLSYIYCVPLTLTWHRVHEKNSSRTLTSIRDEKERNKQLRIQSVHFIETFFARSKARELEKISLLQYAGLLKKMDGEKFNGQMFRYILKNRRLVFHYKRGPLLFFSQLKRAFRMGRKGLL